jgi:hypothetical protein
MAIATVGFLALCAVSEARALPISVCAQNATEFEADVRLRATSGDVEFGETLFAFNVESNTAQCVEWPAPLAQFGITVLLTGAPPSSRPSADWGPRTLPSGEWVCYQGAVAAWEDGGAWMSDRVLDGMVWLIVSDRRSYGYEFNCGNSHNGAIGVVIAD